MVIFVLKRNLEIKSHRACSYAAHHLSHTCRYHSMNMNVFKIPMNMPVGPGVAFAGGFAGGFTGVAAFHPTDLQSLSLSSSVVFIH